jgi:D-amino-acid dehydrogenase
VPVADASKAYSVSLTDDEYKLVFSRLGDRLRIAGTAELNGYHTELNEVRCRAAPRATRTCTSTPATARSAGRTPAAAPALLADLVSGRQPEIDFEFTAAAGMERQRRTLRHAGRAA